MIKSKIQITFVLALFTIITTIFAMEIIRVSGHYIGVDMMLGELDFDDSQIDHFGPIFGGGGGASTSLKQQFCSALASKQPNSCGLDPTQADWAPNGCSNPTDTNGNWNNFFESSCNNHDICYNYMYATQASCDNHFRTNMEIQCMEDPSGSPGKTLDDCTTKAAIYYTGVQLLGSYFYGKAQSTATCDAYHELRKKYCNG